VSAIWFCTGDVASFSATDVVSYRGTQCVATAGHITAAFDGHLYDRRQILAQLGCTSGAVHSDAELVALAFGAWGWEALQRLDGPFAVVVHDAERKTITGARDRFGMRPLYLASSPSAIAFASEMKQFFAAGWLAAKMNGDALLDYLVDGLTDHRVETMFRGVLTVPPAHLVEIDLNERTRPPRFERWYTLPEPGSLDVSQEEAVDAFRTRLIEAVVRQWDQAERRGLCLSGGIDSSAIAVILKRYADGARDVFKASFADEVYDDWPLFHSVVGATGARSHVITCTLAEALTAVDPLVWHLDEPFSHASLAAQWYLFEAAADNGIHALLDGQGADEQLGGYTSMVVSHEEHRSWVNLKREL
jgi:asparagine synthase (glutamine-hydrolysing)